MNGAAVWVLEGTANGDKAFAETAEVVTLGTDPLVFAQIGAGTAYTGGDGITISSNDISVDHDGQGLQFSSNQLALELDGTTLSKSASGLKVAALGITNSEVASAAAIAFSAKWLPDYQPRPNKQWQRCSHSPLLLRIPSLAT